MANKKDPDLKDMIKYAGFAIEIFKTLAHAVLALGGTIEQMRRLIKEPDLVRQIAQLIAPAAEELPPGYSSVEVYTPGLSLEEFERRFPGFVGTSEYRVFCTIPFKDDDFGQALDLAKTRGLRLADRREAVYYYNEMLRRSDKVVQLVSYRARSDGALAICDIAEGRLSEEWIVADRHSPADMYAYGYPDSGYDLLCVRV